MVTDYHYSDLFIIKDKFICAKEKGNFDYWIKKATYCYRLNMRKLEMHWVLFLSLEKNGLWGIKDIDGKTCWNAITKVPIFQYKILPYWKLMKESVSMI
jgi:hypothetical protein